MSREQASDSRALVLLTRRWARSTLTNAAGAESRRSEPYRPRKTRRCAVRDRACVSGSSQPVDYHQS